MTTATKPAAAAVPPAGGLLRPLERRILRSRAFLGRHLSVRWKLTIFYSLMCALTLSVVGAAIWLSLEARTQATIDADLQSAATQIALQSQANRYGPSNRNTIPPTCVTIRSGAVQLYCASMQHTLDAFATQIFRSGNVPGQFEQVQILAGTQSPLIVPSSLGTGVSLNFRDFMLVVRSLTGNKPIYETLDFQNRRTRVLFAPLQLSPQLQQQGVRAVVEVYQVEQTFLEILAVTHTILLVVLPLGVLAALIAGWWIARLALRPIDRISRRVHAIGVSQDLSQRLLFQGPEDEVSRLAITFDGMMARLEALFNAQKRFVADASHELRTPLTAIRGNADLLRIAPPDEREDCIAAIRREAERLSRLVNDLLLLAEQDLQQQPLHLRSVDLCDLLEDVYRSTLVLAKGRVDVRLHATQPVEVQADPDRLKQVFLNLADNAVKFTPDGGTVELSLGPAPGGARVQVRDTGIGIPLEAQGSIFQRFYRVEESRSTRGTGLGLAISASLIEAHGGTISVASTPGEGSVFTVFLPIIATAGAALPYGARAT